MKIVMLVNLFPPKWLAGTEIATYNIAKFLSKKGHEVHVITSLDKDLKNVSFEDGFYIHRINVAKIPLISVFSFYLNSYRIIKNINPQLIHSQSIWNTWATCLLQKLFFKRPYVVYCRGSEIYSKWFLKRIVLKIIFKYGDALIALTYDMEKEMRRYTSNPIYIIPNGIDFNNIYNNYNKECVKKELNLKEEDRIIIFVGNLRPVKGVQYLIQAMKIIQENDDRFKLLIIGDGKEKNNLESLANNLKINIEFKGKMDNNMVHKYLIAGDIFVLPSISEGFPNVIIEAMSAGLPIVTTNIRGLPEIVKDNINGLLVNPMNSTEIADKVLYLAHSDQLVQNISNTNKAEVNKYKWENIIEKLELIYKGVI